MTTSFLLEALLKCQRSQSSTSNKISVHYIGVVPIPHPTYHTETQSDVKKQKKYFEKTKNATVCDLLENYNTYSTRNI